MTEHEDKAFAAVAALLSTISDPAACKKRLGELQAQSEELARREAKLEADRAAFEQHRQRVVAELEQENEKIDRRWNRLADTRNHEIILSAGGQIAAE